MREITTLETEQRNINTINFDNLSTLEMVKTMRNEDYAISEAIQRAEHEIAALIDETSSTLKNDGRIIYIGAGTSGRLGVLDSSECPPTFGVSPELIKGIIAGGEYALRNAVEGAEDNLSLGQEDLMKINLTPNDIVIGLAASGRTPYVIGALTYAHSIGAKTGSICCVRDGYISKISDFPIELIVGPEVLSGSTRLKAGTATKIVLNMISTCSMVKIGKVFQNYMVDLIPSNEKLLYRAKNIIMELTGVDELTATNTLELAHKNVKSALVMLLLDVDYDTACESLNNVSGHINQLIYKEVQ